MLLRSRRRQHRVGPSSHILPTKQQQQEQQQPATVQYQHNQRVNPLGPNSYNPLTFTLPMVEPIDLTKSVPVTTPFKILSCLPACPSELSLPPLTSSATNTTILPAYVTVITFLLQRVMLGNINFCFQSFSDDFTSSSGNPPTISISDYQHRIMKHISTTPELYVLLLIYLDRFLQCRASDVCLSEANVHRILITSAMIAHKFTDDFSFTNEYYAAVAGVSKAELVSLEINFLCSIGFRLFVTSEEFERYRSSVDLLALMFQRGRDLNSFPLPFDLKNNQRKPSTLHSDPSIVQLSPSKISWSNASLTKQQKQQPHIPRSPRRATMFIRRRSDSAAPCPNHGVLSSVAARARKLRRSVSLSFTG